MVFFIVNSNQLVLFIFFQITKILFSTSMATMLVVLLALIYNVNAGDSKEECYMNICRDIEHDARDCEHYRCQFYNKRYYYKRWCHSTESISNKVRVSAI